MQDKNWATLKRIVDSSDFTKPSGFDASLLTLLKKAIEGKAGELSCTFDKSVITLKWLQALCARLKIRASGATRPTYLKDALMKAFQEEKDKSFWEEVRKARKEFQEADKRLEDFYDDLCESRPMERLAKLRERFVDEDGLEDKLKEFRQKFGIKAGASKKTKLETRLRKISEELTARRGVNGLR